MCYKAVDTCIFVFQCIPGQYEAQKMCEKAFSEDYFMPKFCLDRYKIKKCVKKPLANFYQQ